MTECTRRSFLVHASIGVAGGALVGGLAASSAAATPASIPTRSIRPAGGRAGVRPRGPGWWSARSTSAGARSLGASGCRGS